jgi:hypothetical protein
MSVTDEPTTEPEGGQQTPKELRDAYDRAKAERDAAREEAEAGRKAQRELAFLKAGIPTETPVAKLFVSSYSGEMDSDAIKAAWSELGVDSAPTPPPPEDSAATQERLALQETRRGLAGEGAPPGTEPDRDPIEDALKAGRDAGDRGSTQAMGAYFSGIATAANAGDPRVVSQGVVDDETRQRWMAEAHRRQVGNRDRGRS